ncbi:MAG: hypothetical protein QOJ91_645 [Sphingomonadales bacterium]|jgi:hypothetical protein|nr:hypothetical protein [Sphingomonadales bacterium]
MTRPALALALVLLAPLAVAAAPVTFHSMAELAGALGLKKGGWHTDVKVTALDIQTPPGTDPAVASDLRAQIEAKAVTGEGIDECTDPASSTVLLPGMLLENDCAFSRIEGGEGRWALSTSCRLGPGAVSHSVGEGLYSAEAVTGRQAVELSLEGTVIRMKVETASRFIGECRAPPVPVSVDVRKPD